MPPPASRPHEGELTGTTFPSLVYAILRRGETGVLTVKHEGVEKALYIKDGSPLFATSGDPEDRLGNLLLKMGRVSLSGMLAAVEKSSAGKKRLGTVLVEMGAIKGEDLVTGVLAQVNGIIMNLFQWTQGHYRYAPGPLPSDEVITLRLNGDRIILQAVRGINQWERVWEAVGPLDARYEAVKGQDERLKSLDLSPADTSVLARMGQGATLQSLCGQEKPGDFEVCRLLWALKTLGIVKRV